MIKESNSAVDFNCPVKEDWPIHRAEAKQVMIQVNNIHNNMEMVLKHTEHLEKLDVISSAIVGMRDNLVSAATGRAQIETKTATLIFKILGAVSVGLTFIIIFLLTGEKFGLINPLTR